MKGGIYAFLEANSAKTERLLPEPNLFTEDVRSRGALSGGGSL